MALSAPKRSTWVASTGFLAAALLLTACSGGDPGAGTDGSSGSGGGTVIFGTTDKVTALDPAGSFDQGSLLVKEQVYPQLMNNPVGTAVAEPDIAEKAEFTSPNVYTVTLKEGLTFANGHDLTSSDVKHSFDRMLGIDHENGPAMLLYNLETVEAPDESTVVFTLKSENDQVFPLILGSPAGYIVDEEVFPADGLASDNEIVDAKAFAGQYFIDSYEFNSLISFKTNDQYSGVLGKPANQAAVLKFFATSANMKLEVQEGKIDAAYRSLTATDAEDLGKNDKVKIHQGPGGEIRYIVFNIDTQPFGATTDEADAAKSLAVRQAVADIIDRQEIADQVYKGTYTPLYAYIPQGLPGAKESLREYGDGEGGPDVERAKKRLADAGVTETVTINMQYSNDHYGPSSGDEYALIKAQLEDTGLFTVNLQTTEWVQYSKDRVADVFPAYQLGWFPDYSDGDNYITGIFYEGGYVQNHYQSDELDALIRQQASEGDQAAREALIGDINDMLAASVPTLPYLQGSELVAAGANVEGITLDASFKFRFGPVHK